MLRNMLNNYRRKPKFRTLERKELGQKEMQIIAEYNTYQKQAIAKSLCTDSFLLVKGSPGCGNNSKEGSCDKFNIKYCP